MFFYHPYLTIPPWILAQPVVATLLPLALGIGAGFLTMNRNLEDDYDAIKKPSWAPPSWAFGVIWTVLYTALGYASHRSWVRGTAATDERVVSLTKQGATLYTIELVLLVLFIPIFGAGGGKPFLEIFYLAGLVIMNLYLMSIWSHSDWLAPLLILPTSVWLTCATVLNLQIRAMWDEPLSEGKGT